MEHIELSECIYEHIKDTFYHGVFGDFKLVIDKATGYFNATKLCINGGKEYKKWSRLEKSKNMVEYYQKSRGPHTQTPYEVKGDNKDKVEKQITGTYVPFEFFEDIKSWMKFKKTDKSGFVYVTTNSNLEPLSLRKIGYAQNVEERLSTLNYYRQYEPCFYPELIYSSDNAKELETKVHLALKKYAEGKEFFKVSLGQIEETFKSLGYFPTQKHVYDKPDLDLSEVCYEHIKDTFYYGLLGDFKLVIDKATGYFNATKLCSIGDKEFRLWSRTERSKKMVEYYQKSRPYNYTVGFLYEIKGDNKDFKTQLITGTYVPKELILDIASWISIEFYDKCNKVVINHFVKEFKTMDTKALTQKIKEVEESMEKLALEKDEIIKVKDDKIDELKEIMLKMEESRERDHKVMLRQEQYMRSLGISLEEVKDQNEELLDNNKGLKKEVKKVQRKLGIAVEDRAPQPDEESKRERFVLLKRNDPDYYMYYTIRAQDSYTKRRLKSERRNFPNLMVLLDFKCSPNSKTLYTRIKENLKAKNVVFKGNNIDLEEANINEEQLIEEMKLINDAKRDV